MENFVVGPSDAQDPIFNFIDWYMSQDNGYGQTNGDIMRKYQGVTDPYTDRRVLAFAAHTLALPSNGHPDPWGPGWREAAAAKAAAKKAHDDKLAAAWAVINAQSGHNSFVAG